VSETWRLFWALEIPEETRAALERALAPLRRAAPHLRWVAPELWHVTLCFLGDVEESLVASVTAAGVRASSVCDPFELALGGCGTFPPGGPARVWWIGLDGEVERLRRAAAELAVEMFALDLPVEDRPLEPHLTLARVGRRRGREDLPWPTGSVLRAGARFGVRACVLFRSHPGAHGPRYEALARAPLRGA
jgi:2'-5' RNA ligase